MFIKILTFIFLIGGCATTNTNPPSDFSIKKSNRNPSGNKVSASAPASKSSNPKQDDHQKVSNLSANKEAQSANSGKEKKTAFSGNKSADNLYPLLISHVHSATQTDRLEPYEFNITQEDAITNLSSIENPSDYEKATLALAMLARSGNASYSKKNIPTDENSGDVPDENKSGNDVRILESLSSDYEINLGEELVKNPFLKTPEIHRFALYVIAESESSTEYKKSNIANILNIKKEWEINSQKIEAWLKTGNYLTNQLPKEENIDSDSPVSASNGKNLIDSLNQNGSPGSTSQIQAPTDPVDVGEISVGHAKELAVSGQYKNAIAVLTKISADASDYADAQTLSKTFSNTAVQELRRKAAAAYQNSLPVSDKETRKAYLIEAKKHLESALSDYPLADLKSTVKDNLNRILRQLEEFQPNAK